MRTLEEPNHEQKIKGGLSLVLHNDDHNSFNHVTQCLQIICNQSDLQAEQCTLITHYKGKCAIKNGTYQDLEPVMYNLQDNGLKVTIE